LLKIGLVYNLKRIEPLPSVIDQYAEFDDISTINSIAEVLSSVGDVLKVEANEDAYSKLRHERPDIVFNIAEGLKGESRESYIPSILEMLNIPYTGSGPLTLSIALNKAFSSDLLSSKGIRTPRHCVCNKVDDIRLLEKNYPLVVKPLHEGSSKGVWNSSLVNEEKSLKKMVKNIITSYSQPALVEEFIRGREFTVAMIGNNPPSLLPVVEVRLDRLPVHANKIYSYEAKWIWDTCENPIEIFDCPANLTSAIYEDLKSTVLNTFSILGCRDICRIDVRLNHEGYCYVLDVNPLPGLIKDPRANSCFPKAARMAGFTYDDLIKSILYYALERYGMCDDAYNVGINILSILQR